MRILWSTPPMEGAFGPAVPLGHALLDAGHEVLVATGADLQPRVAEEGFAGAVAGPTAIEGAMTAMADPAVQSAGPAQRWRFPATMFGGVIAPAKLPALRDLADAFAPDLVLHPPVDPAGPLLAADRDLPSVCYGFLHPLESAVVRGMAETVAPLWEQAGLAADPNAGLYRRRYLDPCPTALRVDRAATERITWPIRPEIPGNRHAALPDWTDSLGTRQAVYVSLGTVPFFNQPQRFQKLLAELVHEDVDLVVTVSALHDPEALGELGPRVHVERWLPLSAILPRCDAVLCHAGSGTTLAALTAGLPLVLVPDGADQFINADSCRAAGVARVLAPDQLTPTAVRDALTAILAPGSAERTAASATAHEIARMPAAADLADQITRLAGLQHQHQGAPR